MIGSRLGPYEITAKLGEGGMGEVWRATDSRLRREVALKLLPPAFIADPERLARFEREAQLLAQLHHPNVASIFGIEESSGERALVMELVPGPTLAERLAAGPMPFAEAAPIAVQIAQALEAAHEKGIVHRDLKPQNIKAAPDGAVKVLDFGLAKAMDPAGTASAADLARSPTMMQSPTLTAVHGTQLGVILGTAAYMAPEQARGGAVDKRADIWAFGVVLYEMLAGRSLFAGETVSDTLAGVLKTEVDFARLPPTVPSGVRQLLRRCLERNPKNRLHDIADARIVLEDILAGRGDGDAVTLASPPPASRGWRLAALSLVAGVLAGVVAALLWSGRGSAETPPPKLARFEIRAPDKSGIIPGLALSPDGRQLAFVARDEVGEATLWVRPLDSLEARQLPGTEGARLPFWAPDGRRIGFFAQRSLKWIDSRGGTPLDLTPTQSVQDVRGGAWGADDVILYAPSFIGPLLAIPARGGPSAPATALPGDNSLGTMRFPSFLPDGRRFVFYASAGTGTEPGSIHLGRLGSLETKPLGQATSTAVFAPPGYLVYCRGDALVAQAFDDRREELVGDPVPLGITMGGSIAVSGQRSLAASTDGTLVYRSDKRGASEVVWADRTGRILESVTGVGGTWHYAPRLSPDGRSMLVAQYQSNGKLGQFWVHDLERRVASRLTGGESDNYVGTWLWPDGREVLYNCDTPGGDAGVCRVALDRPGEQRTWSKSRQSSLPVSSSRDGRRVIVEQSDPEGRLALWLGDLDSDGPLQRLTPENVAEGAGDISPDGQWLAYMSDTAGEMAVFVRRLDGSGAIRISPGGGTQPAWRSDGRELFYVDALGRLIAVPITPGAGLRPGAPTVLFDARLEEASDRQYDVSADGQRFLLNRRVAADDAPLVVVLDWSALIDSKSP